MTLLLTKFSSILRFVHLFSVIDLLICCVAYYCSYIRIPRCLSSTRVCINRINRSLYGRMYPVYLALANGATIRIRYKEPRRLIQVRTYIYVIDLYLDMVKFNFSHGLIALLTRSVLQLHFFQLPLDLDECDEEERARRLLRRKPKARLELQEDLGFEDSFDETAYDFLWSKTKSK